jgi:hypothetical protein
MVPDVVVQQVVKIFITYSSALEKCLIVNQSLGILLLLFPPPTPAGVLNNDFIKPIPSQELSTPLFAHKLFLRCT